MSKAEQYQEISDKYEELSQVEEKEEEIEEGIKEMEGDIMTSFDTYVMSQHEEISKFSEIHGINATEARKQLLNFPNEYIVQDQTIPDLIRKMRKSRRQLKGEHRIKMSKAIDTMIDAYSDHLQKCIDSITWLNPYKVPLNKMRYNEKDLHKLNKMTDVEARREVVDALCKYWEADLEQQEMVYGKEYSDLFKTMRESKKDFRNAISKISNQSLTKSKKDRQNDFILKMVCENPGINAKGIHERMPSDLFKVTNSNSISKSIKKLDVASYKGNYYKMPSMLKKNVWAYTAAFIDSDGYITLDRNMNPRVGLVATGERGKTFMYEMHKSIGFGRLHLDQKSPQDTRPVNRLNFYSQADVSKLLTKCLPHFRMKKGNAELLLELIRMKKSYKKADWYRGRCDEIFKLMKWENHKDHVGFDFSKENINLDDIQKFKDNCKMSVMDELENIGGIIAKQQVKSFVITYVDWDSAEYTEGSPIRPHPETLPSHYAIPIADLGFPEDWDMVRVDIEQALHNYLEDETGYSVSRFMWHYVDENGERTKPKDFPEYIDDENELEEHNKKYDDTVEKSSKREVRQIQKFVQSRLPVKIIGAEMGSKHLKLTVRNNKTDTTRMVVVSATPSKSGRYNLVVRDIRRTFREVGEDL